VNEAVLVRSGGPSTWARWLSNPTVLLCVVGILLPNAMSIGSLIAGVGLPPRPTMVLVYALLAILARTASPAVTITAYILGVGYDAVSTIALLVNLAPKDIVYALHLMSELKLFTSPLYLAMTIASVSVVAVNLYLLTTRREVLRRGNAWVMLGVAAAFGVTDFAVHASPHYQYGALYATGKPMASATASSGFGQAALAGRDGRNVLLVVVEALGQFRDPVQQAVLTSPLKNAALLERYKLEQGTTTYYGSTTAAEMRELCGTREPYSVLANKRLNCLPQQMAAHGYRTVSMHGFTAKMFDRTSWYPKIGFQKSIFGEDLRGLDTRKCGGPFRGPCDTDLIPLIERELREATQPTFFYWLTLSTHAPVMPRDGTPRLTCDTRGGAVGNAEVCYMTELWMDVLERLAAMLAKLPPTDVLIVGDHAPPLWWKDARDKFEPGKVPWFRLIPRAGAAHAGQSR
jgi:hypothetical protein